MPKTNKLQISNIKKAFSFIEAAIVILIIGIIIAGILIGQNIVTKSRLVSAEALSRSSPVPGIKGNVLWLETSLRNSIDPTQTEDGATISTWHDQSLNLQKTSVVAVGTGPTYANTINHVHAIKFAGSDANYLEISDASFLNHTDYTIIVLEKRQSDASDNYFIGEMSDEPNTSLALGYSTDSTVIHAQGNETYTSNSNVSTYQSSADEARIFTFIHSANSGNSTYINGVLSARDETKTEHLTDITSLAIGKGYTGEIGEIAIYTRALKTTEQEAIEDYAAKKWDRKISRKNGSCTSGVITNDGCDLSNAPCSINIEGYVDTVSATSSPTTTSCNQAGYAGSLSYTCIEGTPEVSGSCSCAAGYTGSDCSSCDTNYEDDNGVCTFMSCTLSGTGIADGTTVDEASGTIDCNADGYEGTFTYTCSMGVGEVTDNSCALPPPCEGGDDDSISVPGSVIHTFTSSGTFKCPNARNVEILVVAGGGGGLNVGGGGGGGGIVYKASHAITDQSYSVTVGGGGSPGNNGQDSEFDTITAYGGGGGGRTGVSPKSGGSGGGIGRDTVASLGASATQGVGGTAYGSPGGGGAAGLWSGGGGGGGAGGEGGMSEGGNATTERGGAGGVGYSFSISGTDTYYGGGGGGGNTGNGNVAPGGLGGGGDGGSTTVAAKSGTPNTGGGGGGAKNSGTGGSGGSGIVIIRYDR